MLQTITPAVLTNTLTFDQYLQLMQDIVTEKIPRQGMYEADSTFRYTQSNLERTTLVMKEIVLNQKLYNSLSELQEEWIWLVLSEPWCGDASWGLTALYMIAQSTDNIDFRVLLRDEYPEIIAAYQTNGGNAIPKMVCLRKSDLKELGTWGPRPQVLQQMVLNYKQDAHFDFKESVRKIHAWYLQDMTKTIQHEIIDFIKQGKEISEQTKP